MAKKSIEELQKKLVLAALTHVVFDGWNRVALRRAAADLSWPRAEVDRLFPRGGLDAAIIFSKLADEEMLASTSREPSSAMKIRDQVARAVRCRLEFLEPNREAIRRLTSFMMLPGNGRHSFSLLYRTVDAIWFAVGDKSADFSFYTKRALLAGVVASTNVFWLEDQSEGCQDTWDFLDRRINDVLGIQKIRKKSEQIRGMIPNPLSCFSHFRSVAS
ncbi:MAG: COQ9 family protein [Alphaproteobacteria bacterium]